MDQTHDEATSCDPCFAWRLEHGDRTREKRTERGMIYDSPKGLVAYNVSKNRRVII